MTRPTDLTDSTDALLAARALSALTASEPWAALVADLQRRVDDSKPKPLPWWRQAWLPWAGLAVALTAVGALVAVVTSS